MKFILTLLALFIGQSVSEQNVSINNPIMKNDIADTWNYDPIALLKKAQNGDDSALNAFVHQFAPFTAVSGNQSKLWVLRPFRIADYSGQRQILSERPDSDDFQWGITVASLINSRSVISHLHLPYGKDFSGLQVDRMDIKILMVDGTTIATNEAELFFKLSGRDKTDDIDRAFASLSNKQYPEPVRISAEEVPAKLPHYGEWTYDTVLHWYTTQIEIANRNVTIYINVTSPDELNRLLVIADKRLSNKFYEEAIRQMQKDMLHLKNDFWLDDDEEPLTEEAFRKRISLNSLDEIYFEKDGSAEIYCDDGEIFHGHTIKITVDANGNYIEAGL